MAHFCNRCAIRCLATRLLSLFSPRPRVNGDPPDLDGGKIKCCVLAAFANLLGALPVDIQKTSTPVASTSFNGSKARSAVAIAKHLRAPERLPANHGFKLIMTANIQRNSAHRALHPDAARAWYVKRKPECQRHPPF